MREYCANPGRGGHSLSVRASKEVMNTRFLIGELFNIPNIMNICFTKNATEAINVAIKGVLCENDHVITTKMEHNSVLRPLRVLERDKNIEISFPVIADMDLKISKLYGMIHPKTSDTATVRAVFIIDPRGIIRTVLYYPQSVGRNIREILRILTALQTHDACNVSTPADWTPGQPVIEPTPQNNNDLHKRIATKNKGFDVQSWYLTFRDLPESKIYEKLNKATKKH